MLFFISESMLIANHESRGVEAGVMTFESVGAVHIGPAETDSVIFVPPVRKPWPDAPHESEGPAPCGKGFVIEEDTSRAVKAAGKFAGNGLFPAEKDGGTNACPLAVPPDMIIRRIARGPLDRETLPDGESAVHFPGFVDVKIIGLDMPVLVEPRLHVFHFYFHRFLFSRGNRWACYGKGLLFPFFCGSFGEKTAGEEGSRQKNTTNKISFHD